MPKPLEPRHPTSIRLRPTLREKLMEIAKDRRWTLAETIVFALEDWIVMLRRRRKR